MIAIFVFCDMGSWLLRANADSIAVDIPPKDRDGPAGALLRNKNRRPFGTPVYLPSWQVVRCLRSDTVWLPEQFLIFDGTHGQFLNKSVVKVCWGNQEYVRNLLEPGCREPIGCILV